MIIIDFLEKIFNFVMPISLLISLFLIEKDNEWQDEDDKKENRGNYISEPNWHKWLKVLLMVCITGLFIVALILIYTKYKSLSWILIVFALPVYMENVTGAYVSVGIVGNIIKSTNSEKLSKKECVAIETLAYAIWFLGLFDFFDFLIGKLQTYSDDVVIDFLLAVLYVMLTFIYIFFICALLPVPIWGGIKLGKKLYQNLPGKKIIRKCKDFFIHKKITPINYKLLTIKDIEICKERNFIVRLIGGIFFPMLFIMDCVVMILKIFLSVMYSCVREFCVLIHLVIKTINKIQDRILSVSDRRVVSISFRVALVIALTSVVVFNRYHPIFKLYDASTSAFEFIASVIVIPIIFEWIYSIRK